MRAARGAYAERRSPGLLLVEAELRKACKSLGIVVAADGPNNQWPAQVMTLPAPVGESRRIVWPTSPGR